jgi:hypothetical protein
MFAQFLAKRTGVGASASGFDRANFRIWAAIALAAASLGGCLPAMPALVGADPADPGAKVATTTYRSTTAPYTAMRPNPPTGWSGRNGGAPASNTEK